MLKTNTIARFYENNGQLFFKLEASSIADTGAAGFVYDSHASEKHKLQYSREYKEYLKLKALSEEVKEEMQAAPVPASIDSLVASIDPIVTE